jgi:hypothetical protein
MRFPSPLLALFLTTLAVPSLWGCATTPDDPGDDGAAHAGVTAEIEAEPEVNIDDEFGTDVRVFVHLEHFGGPDAESLEVVSAALRLDLEPYADLTLEIPGDHPQFAGLADGESFDFQLRGSLPDSHDDWGLCFDPQTEDQDGQRLSLDLVLRVTPGANDDEDVFVFESRAVTLGCSHTG